MPKIKNIPPAASPEAQLNELERLKRDIYRPDMEKFRLLMEMFRRNAALKKAVIRHK